MLICKIASSNGNRFLGGIEVLGILIFIICLGLVTDFLDCCFSTVGKDEFFPIF
ncbi:MAG: hypothetical protein ACTS8R_01830 [Arsenophonus sp. NC-QC1-MAG3]